MCNSIDIELGGAHPGVPGAVAVAVAVGDPLRAAFAVLSADLVGNLSVHDAVVSFWLHRFFYTTSRYSTGMVGRYTRGETAGSALRYLSR